MSSDSLLEARRTKLEGLRRRGIDPFPLRVERTHSIQQIVERHSPPQIQERRDEAVGIAGRIVAMRRMGKASFLDVRDGSGTIQVHAAIDALGEESYHDLGLCDIGDFVGVRGGVFRTKRGELTIAAAAWTFLAKALRPLPEKWHGLKDIELRYRHRALDLLANDAVRESFVRRSHMVSAIRRFLDDRGFLEVETPMLQPIAGGATALPFVTHHNALDIDLYLRIAVELYLKRLVIGGIERVYEIGRDFRNEGVSTEHNPEFTMLEIYEAYTDYRGMMALMEAMIRHAATETLGTTEITYRGHRIGLSEPWPRVPMLDAVQQASGIDVRSVLPDEVPSAAAAAGIEPPPPTWGNLVESLFERDVEPTLISPTFITDYPVDISPLAKRKADEEGIVERFELFVGGMEIANAFTELNDPDDQRGRFEAQEELRRLGDDEAQRVDEEFLFAMEHGMPPTGGVGVGIDRLAMLFTDAASIRDVILFPTLRARGS